MVLTLLTSYHRRTGTSLCVWDDMMARFCTITSLAFYLFCPMCMCVFTGIALVRHRRYHAVHDMPSLTSRIKYTATFATKYRKLKHHPAFVPVNSFPVSMQTTSRLMPPSSRAFCTCSPRQAFVKGARRNPNLIAHRTKRSGKPLSTSLPQTELFHSLLDISAITSRPSLINEDTARDLVRAWGCDKMHDLVVVEPYAGALAYSYLNLGLNGWGYYQD